MNTLDEIRLGAVLIAKENEMINVIKYDTIPYESEIVQDFIDRLMNNLYDFERFEQFGDSFNLYARAFMYVYGKGAEFAYYSRGKKKVERIDYNFHEAMKGGAIEELPMSINFTIGRKISALLDMYYDMCKRMVNLRNDIAREGFKTKDCLSAILNCSFYYGREMCLSVPLSENDKKLIHYDPQPDITYDYDNYNAIYSPGDYRIANIKFGDFKDVINSDNI